MPVLIGTLLAAQIRTRTFGAITHMPPETLTAGVVSKAGDVFSFGVSRA